MNSGPGVLAEEWTAESIAAGPVRLMPVSMDDLDFVTTLYQDWRVARHLNKIPVPFTVDDARAMLGLAITEASESRTATYISCLGNERVGLALLHHGQDDPEARIGVVGYSVVPDHWGRGIATACVEAMAGHARPTGFRTLQASTHSENASSRRVLVKSGFTLAESGFLEESLHSPPREHSKYVLSL